MSGFLPEANHLSMKLEEFFATLRAFGCAEVFCKHLSPNDNTKNQIYLGGDFSILNVLPMDRVDRDSTAVGGSKRDRFRSTLDFSWVNDDFSVAKAPGANLVLYPKYPEVRLSGMLQGVPRADRNRLLKARSPDRVLVLAVTSDRRILAWVGAADSGTGGQIARKMAASGTPGPGALVRVPIQESARDSERYLIDRLAKIHRQGWIDSKRLDSSGRVQPCMAPNCGGLTLEAELGIRPNSRSEPDYLGWEVKQFGVGSFDKPHGRVITLLTPEPDGGVYTTEGVEEFVRKFGYPDKKARANRLNFGGVHRFGVEHPATELKLDLVGFDANTNEVTRTDGVLRLVSRDGTIAASWGFASLLKHWNRKHAQAVYVPSVRSDSPVRRYQYGHTVRIAAETNFQLLLSAIATGAMYYDPGIKLEQANTSSPQTKRRNQFRVKAASLAALYQRAEWRALT